MENNSFDSIIRQLEARGAAISKAIAALQQINGQEPEAGVPVLVVTPAKRKYVRQTPGTRRTGLTPAGRKALSEAMKARWALVKKQKRA